MAKRMFDYTGHPCEPHDIDEHVWYYVQKEGISFCHRTLGNPSEVTLIPWRMVRRALADHEKAKDRRK